MTTEITNTTGIKTEKDVSYYMALAYTLILRRDEEGDVVAKIEELPGCISHGKDEADALANLRAMQEAWLEESLAAGHVIPEPEEEEPLPSGKWVQRVPRSLHKQLAKKAKSEGVSLNQFVTSLLSEAVIGKVWETAAERTLGKFLPCEQLEQNEAQHHWGIPNFSFATVPQMIRCSFNRTPLNVQRLATVEGLFTKPIKVEDA